MELRKLWALGDLEVDLRDEVHRVLVRRSARCGCTLAELAVVLPNLYREIHKRDDHGYSADKVADVPECFENESAPAV